MIPKLLLQKALLFTAFSLTCSLNAGLVISVSDLDADGDYGAITADAVDITGSTTTTPSTTGVGNTGVSSQTMLFQITNLSIDGNGVGDDSVSFSILTSAWGGAVSSTGPSLSLDTPYAFSINTTDFWGNSGALPGTVGSSDSSTSVNPGEILSFSFVSGSVALGSGGSGSYEVSFDGFSAVKYDARGTASSYGAVLALDGVFSAVPSPTGDKTLDLGNATTFALGEMDDTTGYFRLADLDFGVTINAAVPEVETVSLLAGVLSLFALVFIRRRMRS